MVRDGFSEERRRIVGIADAGGVSILSRRKVPASREGEGEEESLASASSGGGRSGVEPRGRSRRRAATGTAGSGGVVPRPASWVELESSTGRAVECCRWASVYIVKSVNSPCNGYHLDC